jgi:cytochrome c553
MITIFKSVQSVAAVHLTAAIFLILPTLTQAADIEAGRVRAQTCIACHGSGGNSLNPDTPSLANQPEQALATMLYLFREGNRKNILMSPMAANLSNTEMNNLAAYFASEKLAPPQHQTKPENLTLGPILTKKYNCTQCHGPELKGLQHIPRIAGQQYDYLLMQLKSFKAATRADMDGNMSSAAAELKDEDIPVLVDYIAGINSP